MLKLNKAVQGRSVRLRELREVRKKYRKDQESSSSEEEYSDSDSDYEKPDRPEQQPKNDISKGPNKSGSQKSDKPPLDDEKDADKTGKLGEAYRGIDLSVAPSYTGWDNKGGKGFMKGLPEFEFTKIVDDALILNIGKRRRGKTTMTDWIMYFKKDKFPCGIVFSHTKFNGFWQQRVPEQYIHEKYDPAILKRLFNRQRKLLQDPTKAHINPACFVILDDCVSQNELMYDEQLKELASAGRHYKIFTIINTQYAYGINPLIRGNTDYVIVFKQSQKRQRDAIVEDYLDTLDKNTAKRLVDDVTKVKHQTLVIDVDSEQLFLGHCKPPEEKTAEENQYVLGCREYWTRDGGM